MPQAPKTTFSDQEIELLERLHRAPPKPGDTFSDQEVEFLSRTYRPVPKAKQPSFLSKTADFLAEGLPMSIGAAGGSALGAPFGPPGIMIGAGLGAATGEALNILGKHATSAMGYKPLGIPAPETSEETARRLAESAGYGVLGEAVPIYKALKRPLVGATGVAATGRAPLTPSQKLAAEFDVPLTPSRQFQTPARSWLDTYLRRTLFSRTFLEHDLEANRRIIAAGGKIAREISAKELSDTKASTMVKEALTTAQRATADNYDQVVDDIMRQGGDVVTLTPESLQSIAKTADSLLKDLAGPTRHVEGLRNVESLNKSISILEGFSNLVKRAPVQRQVGVRTPAHQVAGEVTQVPVVRETRIMKVPGHEPPIGRPPGVPGPPVIPTVRPAQPIGSVKEEIGKLRTEALPTEVAATAGSVSGQAGELTQYANVGWSEAKRLRTLLIKAKGSGEVDIGKAALSKMIHAVDAAMQDSLEAGGRANLAKKFRGASTRFRIVNELLETSMMENIARSENPGRILDVLESSSGEAMKTFRRLVHAQPGVMEAVQRKLWERVFDSAQREGVLVSGTLEAQMKKLGPEAEAVIWGRQPGLLPKIKRFTQLADTLSLSRNLTRPASDQPLPLLAQFQAGAIKTSALGVLGSTAAILSGGPQSVLSAGAVGMVLSLGSLGSMTVLPWQLSRMMTKPENVEIMTRALTTPSNTVRGAQLASRLSVMLGLGVQRTRRNNP